MITIFLRQILISVLLISVFSLTSYARSGVYFVSPGGSDSDPGTLLQPFATIDKAAEVLSAGDTCFLREGVYYETFRPQRSGLPGAEIVFLNYPGEKAILSGADVVTGWEKEEGGIYSAPMPWNLKDGNQVFTNATMMPEASWPAAGMEPLFKPNRAVAGGGTKTTLQCEDIPGTDEAWKGAELWCAGGKAWICWTSTVTAYDAGTHTLTFDQERDTWYKPAIGNLFVLRGVRYALQKPNQWFYDAKSQRLLIIPPGDLPIKKVTVEAKRRKDVIDLSNCSYIHIEGIFFRAGGIRTNNESHHLVFKNLEGRYVSHSYSRDVSNESGVLIHGHDNLVLNCDLGYSSASVVSVNGRDNRIINCFIHHGGYSGLWKGTVSLAGRRIVFSHNTIRHAGRDLVNTHGLMESLVQYNDVSEAGWLTKDLGMFYGHNTDYANTEFRFNLVHDNRAEHLNMGIYFDHLSHNAIVHHNVLWNMDWDPIRFNNPAYGNLVFNNTCWNTGKITTFDHAHREDLFATQYTHNVFNAPVDLPEHVVVKHNLIDKHPPFVNTAELDFRLDTNLTAIGAYAGGTGLWKAGYDPQNPPQPLPEYEAPRIPWMNMVRNACFEFGNLESWETTGASKAVLVKGNGWGVNHATGEYTATGTSDRELHLGPGTDGVSQEVTGLAPGATYTLSAWMKVSDPAESVVLGVRNHGHDEVKTSCTSETWTRQSITFTTGPAATEAIIYLLKPSDSEGNAWCDNVTLFLAP